MHDYVGNDPKVIAVVLNWKDPKNTRQCIRSLQQEQAISQIVVVHNESSTTPFTDLQKAVFNSNVVEEFNPENRGFSAGINTGVQTALSSHADAVLLINNDATLEAGSLDKLVSAMSSSQVGMVAPSILNPDRSLQASGAYAKKNFLSIDEISPEKVNFLTFACVLIKASTFDKVGLLDEAFFMYWEDLDFGLRVKAAGLYLVVVPEATVIHEVSSSRKIAGSRVDLYSAFGLGAFGQLHSYYKVASYFRILFRVTKRIALLQFSFAHKLWRAFLDGQKLERPSYLKVTKENWPL
jgi:GT2 family glycosyltransferase